MPNRSDDWNRTGNRNPDTPWSADRTERIFRALEDRIEKVEQSCLSQKDFDRWEIAKDKWLELKFARVDLAYGWTNQLKMRTLIGVGVALVGVLTWLINHFTN